MERPLTGKTWVIIAVAVVIIAAILVYAFAFMPSSSKNASLGNATYTSAGQLVSGFPADLVLNSVLPSAPDASYRIAYASSTVQTTATFLAARPIFFVAITYTGWFDDNGWTVTSKSPPSLSVQGITATKDGNAASVTIIAQSATSSKVILSYVSLQ